MPPEPDYKSPESCHGGNADRSIAGAQARLIAACPRTSREEFRLELRNYNGDLKLRFGVFKKNRLGEFEETSRAVVFSPLILRDVKERLLHDFRIDHTTIQFENVVCEVAHGCVIPVQEEHSH